MKEADKSGNVKDVYLGRISRIENFFYGSFWYRVPLFIVGVIFLRILFRILLIKYPAPYFYISLLLMSFLTLYLIIFVLFLVKRSIQSLLSAKNLWALSLAYVMLIFSILLLFSSAYSSAERMGNGYLTYGMCNDKFDSSMISQDQQKSSEYFYFSAVTMFTVGYGDICPMGLNKYLALVNAFSGTFINTIIVAIVIASYLRRKE